MIFLLIAHLALIVGSLAACWFLDEPDAGPSNEDRSSLVGPQPQRKIDFQ